MLRLLDGEVVILSAARTPVGAYNGWLKDFRAPDLGSFALKAAIERGGLKPEDLDEVFMGNAVAGGLGQNPTKQAAFAAGVPMTTPTTAVNVVCASGLGAIFEGIRAILAKTGDIVAAGGMESVACILMLTGGFVHPSLNCEDVHPEIEAYAGSLPHTVREMPELKTIIKAGFGFGDVNTCVIFRRWND